MSDGSVAETAKPPDGIKEFSTSKRLSQTHRKTEDDEEEEEECCRGDSARTTDKYLPNLPSKGKVEANSS
jgi:hypothetical protein